MDSDRIEGKAKETEGEIQQKWGEAKDKARDTWEDVTNWCPAHRSPTLPARSRTNIWVNEEEFPGLGKALASAEFSAVIESQDGTPIIAERAMYRSNQGRTFNAGHASMGVTAPATDWFLAEGTPGRSSTCSC